MQLIASGWAHVSWSWQKRRLGKSKLTRSDALQLSGDTSSTTISNVEIKNMESSENSDQKLMFLTLSILVTKSRV